MLAQDWLNVEFGDSAWLKGDIAAARTWLLQMNDGCEKSNATIQMCMSLVRHVLQSTEMPAVTNARASGDYHPGSDQWDIGAFALRCLACLACVRCSIVFFLFCLCGVKVYGGRVCACEACASSREPRSARESLRVGLLRWDLCGTFCVRVCACVRECV
jgi:hypothetical protein